MAIIDANAKKYTSQSGQFCDLINAAVYSGRKVLKPGNLIPLDTEEYTTQFRKLPAKIRDTLKKCVIRSDGKNYYILIGLENTSYVDFRLPLKASLYNLLNLESQFDAMWNRFTAGNQSCTEDERLSRRRKKTQRKSPLSRISTARC